MAHFSPEGYKTPSTETELNDFGKEGFWESAGLNQDARFRELDANLTGASADAAQALQTANSYAGQIAQANTTAGSAVAIAQGAADDVDEIKGPIDTRLSAVETAAGYAPGDATDAAMTNIATQDNTQFRAALNAQSVGRTGQQNMDGTAKLHFNGGFTPNYDTVLWIASQQRVNPELNSQGLYIQHRVAGDLHNKVHDAAASELRLNGVTNTGSGQSAHENTLVVGGGGNDINLACVTLSTFHPDADATGSINEINMFRANQVLPAPGLIVDKAVSGFFAAQTVGTENYAIWANGDSAFARFVPQSPTSIAVDIRTRAGQTADLLAVNTAAKIFSVTAAGTAHFGAADAGSWVSVHNRDASKAALRVKAHGSQATKVLDVTDSGGTSWVYVANNGDLRTVNRSVVLRNASDTGTTFELTALGPRWRDASTTRNNAGAAGSATALPATPQKYLKVFDPDGVELLIPAYRAP
ncbi:hypothetical protein [Citricoccus sp. K5]|uniref:hypothetical protein n=1 Tax=Citricoccus sp. K5 TaxID=2653135 RepID=UPI0012F0FBC6|nr:hypothetical protein [Citricoccus sp. K5]VXB22313.1 hypothetical protein CITRIK5_20642 [Citricoccus sp. K5]